MAGKLPISLMWVPWLAGQFRGIRSKAGSWRGRFVVRWYYQFI